MKNPTINDVMTPMVIWINERDSILAAAKKMADCNIGSLPVVNDAGDLIGIVTDRDIIIRACAKNLPLDGTIISNVMTENPQTCTPDSEARKCADRMAELQIRRMPVVDDNGKLLGYVALADLAVHLQDAPQLVGLMMKKLSSPNKPWCEAA